MNRISGDNAAPAALTPAGALLDLRTATAVATERLAGKLETGAAVVAAIASEANGQVPGIEELIIGLRDAARVVRDSVFRFRTHDGR
jgi:hypothetical protein